MNISTYIFGEFNSGYSQYPNDYTASIFEKFSTYANSITQIAIHRDGNLIYYGYVRKLQGKKYIGLCVVVNSWALPSPNALFPLFEHTISTLVENGLLIHFDEQGNLTTSVEKLYLNKEEIEFVGETLRKGFDKYKEDCVNLPPVSYGTSKDSIKTFSIEDDKQEIFKSSYTNGYTLIYKFRGYNTSGLYKVQSILEKEYKLRHDLEKEIASLKEDYKKLENVQKRTKLVACLIFILFLVGGGLAYFGYTASERGERINQLDAELDDTKKSLSTIEKKLDVVKDTLAKTSKELKISEDSVRKCNEKIVRISEELSFARTENYELSTSNAELERKFSRVRTENSELKASNKRLKEQLSNSSNTTITSISPGYEKFEFTYTSNKDISDAQFDLKIIKTDESITRDYSFKASIYSGSGKISHTYPKLSNGYYHFLLYCNGKIVAYKRW